MLLIRKYWYIIEQILPYRLMVDKANKAKIFAMALEWFTYQSPKLSKTKMTRCSLVYDPHATTEATGVGEPMFNVGEIVADPGAFAVRHLYWIPNRRLRRILPFKYYAVRCSHEYQSCLKKWGKC